MRNLPMDRRGFPIPWFVAVVGGEPEFRLSDPRKIVEGWRRELCWVCGGRLPVFRAWVMGPASVIEGASPEPPCHLDCGRFSAMACPFLSNPEARRNQRQLPRNFSSGSEMITANSAATALWVTKGRGADPIETRQGLLFKLREPDRIEWYARGGRAPGREVRSAFAAIAPRLRASAEREGQTAIRDFERRLLLAESRAPATDD
ncbi:MAG: hypothetical protein ACXWKY_06055 [Caulobacteraceae bacterium]